MSTLPCNPCHVKNATSVQKGKDKKAKYDESLQELRKNKKELEFEQKLYKEKEEMLEKEKQLKINRLAQEVRVLLTGPVSTPVTRFGCSPSCSQGTGQSCPPHMESKGGMSLAPLPLSVESEIIAAPHPRHPRSSETSSDLGICLGLSLASLLRCESEAKVPAQTAGLRLGLRTPGQRFALCPPPPLHQSMSPRRGPSTPGVAVSLRLTPLPRYRSEVSPLPTCH